MPLKPNRFKQAEALGISSRFCSPKVSKSTPTHTHTDICVIFKLLSLEIKPSNSTVFNQQLLTKSGIMVLTSAALLFVFLVLLQSAAGADAANGYQR